MSDLIDRQAAIDALGEQGLITAMVVVDRLPSAWPKITCDGCRFVGTYNTDLPCRNCVRREKDYYDPER